jgi:hypothetical protein
MQRHIYLAFAFVLFSISFSCGGETRGPTLRVGDEPSPVSEVDAGSAPPPPATAPSAPTVTIDDAPDFSVGFENSAHASITQVDLPCGTDCVDVEAVAHGGTAPYHFQWTDGSSDAVRHLCPGKSTTFSVSATDTAVQASEFGHGARTKNVVLIVQKLGCVDAAVSPIAAAPDAGTPTMCLLPPSPPCDLGGGNVLPEDVTVDVPGATTVYFAHGAMLPAGRYRISYVDGCNTYGIGVGWTVHAAKGDPGTGNCSIVGDNGPFLLTPGTELWPETGDGEAQTYPECVTFNCKLAPVDFDFPGGKLGVLRDGGTALGAIDDATGAEAGGRSPTFRLTRLDACP